MAEADIKDKWDAAAMVTDIDPDVDKLMVLVGGVVKGMFPKNFEAGRITAGTPASAGATGSAGQIKYDATHLYVCVATNTWVRTTLATW